MPRPLKKKPSARKFSKIDCIIGANLKHEREIRGLTQTDLGRALGVSYQQIQKYENGKSRLSTASLYLISNFLGAPITAFFHDLETIKNPAYIGRLPLDKKELELVSIYKNLDPSSQKSAREFFKAISEK